MGMVKIRLLCIRLSPDVIELLRADVNVRFRMHWDCQALHRGLPSGGAVPSLVPGLMMVAVAVRRMSLPIASSLLDRRATWKRFCYKNATMVALSKADL